MCIRDRYLPVVENYDDNYKRNIKIITYDHTNVDRTLLDLDLIYDFEIVNKYETVDYYDYNNKIYLLDNKINRTKIRMLFNDGG